MDKNRIFRQFLLVTILLGAMPLMAWSAGPFTLADPGAPLVDYNKYGKFHGIGTADYSYEVTDPAGLAQASGEGIYPNEQSVLNDPNYQKVKDSLDIPTASFGLWEGDPEQAQINFYRWAASKQDPASKLYFVGKCFEDAQMWYPALKAYYALLVQFPTATRKNTGDSWSWSLSLGEQAKENIIAILREHPELGLSLKDCDIDIQNVGADNQSINRIHPGYFVRASAPAAPALDQVIRRRGNGKVQLTEYQDHHWIMTAEGKPYFIQGLCYGVTKVGESPDLKNMVGFPDLDNPDGVFDSWVDQHKTNTKDADDPTVGDPALLKNMGCNTIRLYYGAKSPVALERFCKESGVKVAMGVAFGAYALDSGATWEQGTDYTDPVQQQNILDVLKKMVLEYKDKPYILCWILGNENNFGVACNANKYPATYCDLVERACRMVHELDPDHPVAACLGEVGFVDKMAQFAPDLDILAINAYRGSDGFGDLWDTIQKSDKPVMISEFGCPAYFNGKGEDEADQAKYIVNAWKDIAYNRGSGPGVGNSLGGFVFEWMDEWWKAGPTKPANEHDTSQGQWQGPFPDGWGHEEWFGICSQGDGKNSPWERQLRQSYWDLKKLWTGGS